MDKAVKITINGSVQGVGFRFFVKSKANQYGVNGWVRNLSNGDVEVLAEGPQEAVDRLTSDCQHGPPFSRVNGTTVHPIETLHGYNGFSITG